MKDYTKILKIKIKIHKYLNKIVDNSPEIHLLEVKKDSEAYQEVIHQANSEKIHQEKCQ